MLTPNYRTVSIKGTYIFQTVRTLQIQQSRWCRLTSVLRPKKKKKQVSWSLSLFARKIIWCVLLGKLAWWLFCSYINFFLRAVWYGIKIRRKFHKLNLYVKIKLISTFKTWFSNNYIYEKINLWIWDAFTSFVICVLWAL